MNRCNWILMAHTSRMESPISTVLPEPLLVACLCAQWCGICRDYQARWVDTLVEFGPEQVRVVWVDIEDHDEVLGDLDVQSFPTLLLARGDRPVFFGTLTPQPSTLVRLVQSALAGDLGDLPADAELLALVERVQGVGAPRL